MLSDKKLNKIVDTIKNDGIGVMPTDTLYGVVGSAFSVNAVKKIYNIKGRDDKKAFIILIDSISTLKKFGFEIDDNLKRTLKKFWPGKVSIILSLPKDNLEKFNYLHRGEDSLAFRFPNKESLINILRRTGPLVAPSANTEGKEPALNVAEAKEYFGDKVDFYLAEGMLKSKPSALIKINEDGKIEVLRGTI
ncbi:MAG: L-threonylcarbamoyladenylate synthase [bacterium]